MFLVFDNQADLFVGGRMVAHIVFYELILDG
jgi:hypothetical protein